MNIDLGARAHDGRCSTCLTMAADLHAQLSNGYTHDVSARPLEQPHGKTLRRRSAAAERAGYYWNHVRRSEHEDAIYEINTSAPRRQGRPMAPAYGERPHYGLEPPKFCLHHHVYPYGVFHHDTDGLVAYLWLYRCGDLALVSSILGHADHLDNDVMYLLVRDAIENQIALGLGGELVYNLHTSGTDGLRYFKERLGFTPTEVTWTV